MSFLSPQWLLALALVPALLGANAVARRRARRFAIRFPAMSTLQLAAGARPAWRRVVPLVLTAAAVAAIALALARPRISYATEVGQASVMLVTDHSGSMAAADVTPTRLAAAEHAADSFIGHMPTKVSVGAIAFSDSPDAVQAPTTNHALAQAIIDSQNANGATATGDALELALQLLHGSDRKHAPSAIVLLSDGAANTGLDSATVSQEAARDRIPIYTVALGTPDGTLPSPDPFGPPIAVPPDPQLMQQIASLSGGRSFTAQSASDLNSIYGRLGSRLGTVSRKREVTYAFVAGGLVLLLLAGLGSVRWSARLP
jgi:Ca-activated chloride channel family protein